jgi:TRAP-type C4-dicarboxylate transport system substrate-binding protein
MLKMKKTIGLLFSIIYLSLSTSVGAVEIKLRLGSGHPVGLLAYTKTAADWFAPELKKRIESRTKHTVKIQELHAGQVAKVTEVLEATRDGLLDIGFTSHIFEPSNGFINNFTLMLPFNSPDARIVTKAALKTYKKFPELTSYFEKDFNQKYLGGACLANYGVGTNFKWSKFSDLKGHKIAGAGINLDWIKGATPVASNLNKAYQSIQTGVYEGYLSASPWWYTFKLHEIAPYYTKTDFGAQFFNSVSINKNTYNKLPKNVQEIVVELGEEWAMVTAEVCANNDSMGLDKLKKLGVNVSVVSEQAKIEWATALKDFPNKMAQELNKRGYRGSEILKFYMAEVEKLGHKWPYRYQIN